MGTVSGYHGILLEVDLSGGVVKRREVDPQYLRDFTGGRGLGMRLLWDALPSAGIDPLSPGNPLLFMPGPFTGLPLPSAARTCVVTKSPVTSPKTSPHTHGSTVAYSNMGGCFAPEIRFAGYDGIMVTGRADHPVYLHIDDDQAEIRDGRKFWGMGTDRFDQAFTAELGDRRFQTCCIGPAGENRLPFACIINTTARAAGRSGTGAVMGSKNLKAIAIRGSGQPDVAQHKRFLELLEEMRLRMRESVVVPDMRRFGTAKYLEFSSALGLMATKNYREGTFENVASISAKTAREQYWQRDFACFLCPAACKKAGVVPAGPYAGTVHDGPEYETGSMLGSNLLIPDLPAVLKAIYLVDDFGIDAISAGNIIGFLMEAYEKRLIDRAFLDGIDLQWGNAEAVFQVLRKMAYREGIGNEAAQGVRRLADKIGQDSHKFAIHCKGQEFAGWNCHPEPSMALGYALSNRGACHLSGRDSKEQDDRALNDSTGICMFLQDEYGTDRTAQLLQSVTGLDWTADDYRMAGERIFTLEKCFNLREGFCRDDDTIPDRFFEEPYTTGPKKDAVLDRSKFEQLKTAYYDERGWDPETTRPGRAKLESLGLAFADST